MRALLTTGPFHSLWRHAPSLVLLGLLLAAAPWALAAEEPKPEAATAGRVDLLLRCESLHPKPLVQAGDCHSAPILLKKAFYDRALKVRLLTNPAGPDEPALPTLTTRMLLYRKAIPLPLAEEGRYQWSYRGLLFWSLDHPATDLPLVAGYYDLDSGRSFEGGRTGGLMPHRLRTAILGSVARSLPERVYPYIERYWEGTRFIASGTGERVSLQSSPAPGEPLAGPCGEHLPDEETRRSAHQTAAALAISLAAAPELSGASGPWQGRLALCPQGEPRLAVSLAGNTLRAEASCLLREPLTLSAPGGVIAQCAVELANQLRTELVRQHLASAKGGAGR